MQASGDSVQAEYRQRQARAILDTQRDTRLAALFAVLFMAPFGTLLGAVGLLAMIGSQVEVQTLDVGVLRKRFKIAKVLTWCAVLISVLVLVFQAVAMVQVFTWVQSMSTRPF
jgi:hypothetical protein